eukprot:TRINITY_DN7220_c0_g1_i1.p1 TRINITY_DN7220_c0_g1~~TRINITY_DN7220_c0_g1_i1.p1  ORF type:complete len:696 (-),score=153.23 TRINITY_DN7220_c0_g1_i1:408-2495(-)
MGPRRRGDEGARSRSPPAAYKIPSQGDANPVNGKKYSKRFFDILDKRQKLPCWAMRKEVVEMCASSQSSVLIGDTGSGKTTQVPQMLFDAGYAKKGLIAVTQPRRVAAMSVASRVAQEMDVELGEEVGYLIRFEDVTSDKTKIKYMTDGMLLRECMDDPQMTKYSIIVLDEAHERTLSTDILFGLLKEVLVKRPDLRCLIMSATLEAEKFQEYWSDAPLLRVPGRMYPVETFFTMRPEKDYVQSAVDVCVLIHTHEPAGDILLFLTGEEEIETACALIRDGVSDEDAIDVLPLYSSLPMQQQRRVFPPAEEGVRKVIVATNIAETSLTIDGVVYVVDPGLVKQKLYNPRTHVESLLVSPISQAAAKQRAGRAGRTRPGKCFRLYTKDTFDAELPGSQYPEIIRSNLCSVVITLKKLGVDDLVHFDFMEPPSPESMMRALEMLYFLSAIDEESDLTEIGRYMADYPIDPHMGRMMISAARRGCVDEVTKVVSMLSVPPPFSRPRWAQKAADRAHKTFASGFGDHLSLLNTFLRYEEAGKKTDFCKDNFLHDRAMKQACSIFKQLRGILNKQNIKETMPESTIAAGVRKSLLDGFFMQSAYIDQNGKNYLTAHDQQLVSIHPGSFLGHKPEWVVYHETVVTDRNYMRGVTAIPGEMLIEVAPKFYHPENCKFNDYVKKLLQRALPKVPETKTNGKKK